MFLGGHPWWHGPPFRGPLFGGLPLKPLQRHADHVLETALYQEEEKKDEEKEKEEARHRAAVVGGRH